MKISLYNIFRLDWSYRIYQLWVINTAAECQLYLWNNWCQLLPPLDNLIGLTQQAAFIRTFQSYPNGNKWLGFGRMKWSEENNIKWTTQYRKDPLSSQPEFYGTEIWAPDWSRVSDTGMPPDVFISLYHYPSIPAIKEGLFIALPRSLYNRNKSLIDQSLTAIASRIPGSRIYGIKRDWWGRTASRNNIEDMNPQEVMEIIRYK